MFCPLCRNAMSYDSSEDSYRCSKTDFHHNRNVVVTVGLTRFKGSLLKQGFDIDKSHVLLILKKSVNDKNDIMKESYITVNSKPNQQNIDRRF